MTISNIADNFFTMIVFSIVILLLPFLMLFNIMPFVSESILSEDYVIVYLRQQMELFFSLKTGTFPLFMPDFAGGQSAFALTVGQIFHPIAHLASCMPGYWSGCAFEWITLLKLISLGCAHLSIFIFLKRINLNNTASFIVSTVTVYNLRMLDLFRYGASLESWTGLLFLCSAIGFYYLNPKKITSPIMVIASLYWLICSGHAQMMYYALLGGAVFAVLTPFYIPATLPSDKTIQPVNVFRFWIETGLCFIAGILLSSAYISSFYFDFVSNNAGRVDQSYAWADGYRDTFMGTLNNFFLPFLSDVHGAFGGSSLFLLILILPLLHLVKVKIPKVIWIILGICLIIFLYAQGSRTPVHYLAWKYMPLASSFRVAGRITIILPIFIMMLLTWLMRDGFYASRLKKISGRITTMSFLSVIGILLMGMYLLSPETITSSSTIYSAASIRNPPSWIMMFHILLGISVLFFLLLHSQFPKINIVSFLFCLLVCMQIQILLHYGTWIEQNKKSPTFLQMMKSKKSFLGYLPEAGYGYGMYSATVYNQLEKSFLEPFLGRIAKRYIPSGSIDETYRLLSQKELSPDHVVIEGFDKIYNEAQSPDTNDILKDEVTLVYSSYNKLAFDVTSSHPGFFILSYPFSQKWHATLNGKDTKIFRANGAAQAIFLPDPGKHYRIEMKYHSRAAYLGLLVSCIVLSLFLSIPALKILKPGFAVPAIIIILLTCFSFIFYWQNSLHSGDNLGFQYAWAKDESYSRINLAYGKKTNMSSIYWEDHPHLFHSSRAVDGNRKMNTGSKTNLQEKPFWQVDLNEPKPIARIKIFESVYLPEYFNKRPLDVLFSNDKKNWEKVISITNENKKGQITMIFEKPSTTRFIEIRASGKGFLQLDEVEIFSK